MTDTDRVTNLLHTPAASPTSPPDRRSQMIAWLTAHIGLPVAMWGATGTAHRMLRFVDGARLEVLAPVEATNLALDRLRSGLPLCIERVDAVPGAIAIVLAGADRPFPLSAASVYFDPSTGSSGGRWIATSCARLPTSH